MKNVDVIANIAIINDIIEGGILLGEEPMLVTAAISLVILLDHVSRINL